jgi:hypothetical protein
MRRELERLCARRWSQPRSTFLRGGCFNTDVFTLLYRTGFANQGTVTGPIALIDPMSYSMKSEIDGSRPFLVRIKWNSGGSVGHFMSVVGYDDKVGDVLVVDPLGNTVWSQGWVTKWILEGDLAYNSKWTWTHSRIMIQG